MESEEKREDGEIKLRRPSDLKMALSTYKTIQTYETHIN